jgi:hypothetical protein
MDEYSRREFVKMSVPAFPGVTLMLPSITAFAKQANAHHGLEKIHRVSADEFCQVIDLFTPPYDEGRIRKSRWFEVDPEPFGGRPDLFEAETK